MDVVKFIHERRRMCDSYNICSECPIHSDTKMDCDKYLNTNPENYVKIVEKWSAGHPVKTRQSEFLKMFPNALTEDGVLDVSPCEIDVNYFKGCEDNTGCQRCKKDYWLAEVE